MFTPNYKYLLIRRIMRLYFFYLTHFRSRQGQKSWQYFIAFLENFKTPQIWSEIIWPLVKYICSLIPAIRYFLCKEDMPFNRITNCFRKNECNLKYSLKYVGGYKYFGWRRIFFVIDISKCVEFETSHINIHVLKRFS